MEHAPRSSVDNMLRAVAARR